MKTIFCFALLVFCFTYSYTQKQNVTDTTTSYRIIKTDGGEILGKILSQDSRELLVLTKDNRQIYIPQHTVKKIIAIKSSDYNVIGEFVGEDKFATRYFITTNGLPIKKGEHYVQWNLYGPDFQFSIADNVGVGILTSWIGMPIIGSAKYSIKLNKHSQFAVGALVGTGSWAHPDWGGAMPFGTLSFGDRSKNIAISGGYGSIWENGETQGRALTSVAGMIKISPKISVVFDSFILLPNNSKSTFALLIPGVRWHQSEGKAFQFGFTGIFTEGKPMPVAIPMVQWYRSI